MNREEVLRILRKNQDELAQEYGVKSLSLFGSVARNQANDASDVDILVEFSRPIGLFEFFSLQDRIEQLLDCAVDLGTPESLKPRIRERVLAERYHAT